jgi:hypothetical protein
MDVCLLETVKPVGGTAPSMLMRSESREKREFEVEPISLNQVAQLILPPCPTATSDKSRSQTLLCATGHPRRPPVLSKFLTNARFP